MACQSFSIRIRSCNWQISLCCWHLQELNLRGSHLLYRDKRHQLHLYDLQTQQRSSLLDYCQYVQWVPGSDVVVAQSRNNLCVWYSVKDPDRWALVAFMTRDASWPYHASSLLQCCMPTQVCICSPFSPSCVSIQPAEFPCQRATFKNYVLCYWEKVHACFPLSQQGGHVSAHQFCCCCCCLG